MFLRLEQISELAPPFHLTTEGVDIELESQRAQPLKIKAHRLNRGPGGTLNVQFETQFEKDTNCRLGNKTLVWANTIDILLRSIGVAIISTR